MIIGITGNIGSGKSEVSKIFAKHSFKIINADKIGHKLLIKNKKLISKLFGKRVLKNNKIDRKKLGNIVFNDKKQLKKLNDAIHPLIKKEIGNLIVNKKVNCIIEAAILVESNWHKLCDKIVLVKSPKISSIKRLVDNNGYSRDKIKNILKTQFPNKRLEKYADIVINNNKDFKHLEKQCLRIISLFDSQ